MAARSTWMEAAGHKLLLSPKSFRLRFIPIDIDRL